MNPSLTTSRPTDPSIDICCSKDPSVVEPVRQAIVGREARVARREPLVMDVAKCNKALCPA